VSKPSIEDQKNAKTNAQSQASVESGGLRERVKASPVAFVVLCSAVVGAVVTLMGGWLAWQQFVVSERNSQLAIFAEQSARMAGSNVANFLHSVDTKLEFFAKSSGLATPNWIWMPCHRYVTPS